MTSSPKSNIQSIVPANEVNYLINLEEQVEKFEKYLAVLTEFIDELISNNEEDQDFNDNHKSNMYNRYGDDAKNQHQLKKSKSFSPNKVRSMSMSIPNKKALDSIVELDHFFSGKIKNTRFKSFSNLKNKYIKIILTMLY